MSVELPNLPSPAYSPQVMPYAQQGGGTFYAAIGINSWSDAQMRSYAIAAVMAERERLRVVGKVTDAHPALGPCAINWNEDYRPKKGDLLYAAIRNQPEPT